MVPNWKILITGFKLTGLALEPGILAPGIMCSTYWKWFWDTYFFYWNVSLLYLGTVIIFLVFESRIVLELEDTFSLYVLNKWLGIKHGPTFYFLHHRKKAFNLLEMLFLIKCKFGIITPTKWFWNTNVRNKWNNEHALKYQWSYKWKGIL